MSQNILDTIDSIMQDYPEDQWLDICHQKLPDVHNDGVFLSAFEALADGDIEELGN